MHLDNTRNLDRYSEAVRTDERERILAQIEDPEWRAEIAAGLCGDSLVALDRLAAAIRHPTDRGGS